MRKQRFQESSILESVLEKFVFIDRFHRIGVDGSRIRNEKVAFWNENGYVWTGLSPLIAHPRRPRGSQSGREKGRDESFQVRVKEPLGTDCPRTISKNSSGCRLLIGHKKCFVLLCPISEQHLLSSFREFVHDGYWLDHGLSGSCTKEMHAVRKLSVWYKIPIWFQNTVCPKTKDAFPKIQAWAYNRYSRLHLSRLA